MSSVPSHSLDICDYNNAKGSYWALNLPKEVNTWIAKKNI